MQDQPIESECQLIESPVVESFQTDNNLQQEQQQQQEEELDKEPVEVEERHIVDDIEKDLQLEVETEDTNEMDSQLNPDAKEFVPLSPVRNEFASPPPGMENGKSPFVNQILSGFSDPVVSQSPRKGEAPVMEDVQIPEEKEFDKEADARAHEVNLLEENFQRIESPQEQEEMNLKEAMQTDDKLEQGYKDDSQVFFEEEKIQTGEEYKVLESSFDQYSNGFQSKIDDPMNRSFYEGRDNDILADPAKSVLNTTQPLSDDDLHQEQKQEDVEKSPPEEEVVSQVEEIDFLGSSMEPVVEQIKIVHQYETMQEKEPQISQMESSDNFEAEKFVEEIKGINESFNKYVDTELSPTVVKDVSHEIENVEETIFATHSPMKTMENTSLDTFITQTSTVSDIEVAAETQQSLIEEFENQPEQNEFKENILEGIESVIQQQELIPTMEAPAHEVTPPLVEDKSPTPQEESPLIETAITEEPQKKEEEETKIESKTEEIVAATVATAAVAATAIAATKKSSTTAAKKPEAKKVGDAKSKAPVKPAEVKKTEAKPKTTSVAKPPAAKPPVSKAQAPSKPATTTAASRPKTATTIPPVKKAPLSSAKPAETKPAPKTTVAPKRPVTSAPTTK